MARKKPGKSISFELLLDEGSKTRARIPLRVIVNHHDTTESVIATVKNFYGIYDGHAVSFEDHQGNTLIASYENLDHNTVVYVRSVPGPSPAGSPFANGQRAAPAPPEPQRRPDLGEPFQMMLPPHMRDQSHSPSRSSSRLARKRSASPPQMRGRRSASQQKPRSFSAMSRGSSASGSFHEDGYSDSEAGRSSISGSRKARSEQIASSDISTANVLQDGRRGQTIFDSSTLPLYLPPQVPIAASQSSMSPQRRPLPQEAPSPFRIPAQKLSGIVAPPMLSPQSYGHGPSTGMFEPHAARYVTTQPQHSHHLRDRGSSQYTTPGRNGVLPTPDPTVASCISDEDVARTLMALGDASNYSHGQTSNSTMDDTFSGAADAASSTGATSDSEDDSEDDGGLPKHRRSLNVEDDDYEQEGLIKSEYDEYEGAPKTKKIKTKMHDGPTNIHRSKSASLGKSKAGKVRSNKPSKVVPQTALTKAISAPVPPTQVCKGSTSSSVNMQAQIGVDDEDLSSKPRCQRCRKSKKGCDRQRPCQRCKDAGIGIEGCVSEDEGNGRKGRYGRHMGVPLAKTEGESDRAEENGLMLPPAVGTVGADNSKKRKR